MKFLEFHFRSCSRERSFKSARKLFDSSSHHMLAYVTQPTRCRGCVKNHTTSECEKKRCDSARQSPARLSISIYYDSTQKNFYSIPHAEENTVVTAAREREDLGKDSLIHVLFLLISFHIRSHSEDLKYSCAALNPELKYR